MITVQEIEIIWWKAKKSKGRPRKKKLNRFGTEWYKKIKNRLDRMKKTSEKWLNLDMKEGDK